MICGWWTVHVEMSEGCVDLHFTLNLRVVDCEMCYVRCDMCMNCMSQACNVEMRSRGGFCDSEL